MSQSARVTSIEMLVDFRAALCTFGERAGEILSSVQMAVARASDWLENQTTYWQRELRAERGRRDPSQIELSGASPCASATIPPTAPSKKTS